MIESGGGCNHFGREGGLLVEELALLEAVVGGRRRLEWGTGNIVRYLL
ncbi:hypothetical protein [Streptomyces sp. NPDC021969]